MMTRQSKLKSKAAPKKAVIQTKKRPPVPSKRKFTLDDSSEDNKNPLFKSVDVKYDEWAPMDPSQEIKIPQHHEGTYSPLWLYV